MAEFVTVMKERERLCKHNKFNCANCRLASIKNGTNMACFMYIVSFPEEAEKIIMDWAAEHPVTTLRDKFFGLFPDGLKNDRGEPHICPRYLGWVKECDDYSRCSCNESFVCTKWKTPWEEEE